jgi:hypothetical protein
LELSQKPDVGVLLEFSYNAGLCNAWEGGYSSQPMARRCETLAASALTGYGDEIDVVAPVDILKQIFKTPYCKSRLSVEVHQVGHTLILNNGYVLVAYICKPFHYLKGMRLEPIGLHYDFPLTL